jgi:hypothetical protein
MIVLALRLPRCLLNRVICASRRSQGSKFNISAKKYPEGTLHSPGNRGNPGSSLSDHGKAYLVTRDPPCFKLPCPEPIYSLLQRVSRMNPQSVDDSTLYEITP